jgi:hypothetical protein
MVAILKYGLLGITGGTVESERVMFAKDMVSKVVPDGIETTLKRKVSLGSSIKSILPLKLKLAEVSPALTIKVLVVGELYSISPVLEAALVPENANPIIWSVKGAGFKTTSILFIEPSLAF